jgi:hypothetical protein
MKLSDALALEARVLEAKRQLNHWLGQAAEAGLEIKAEVLELTSGVQIRIELGVQLWQLKE